MAIIGTAQSLRGRCEVAAAKICEAAQKARRALGDPACTDAAIAKRWKDTKGETFEPSYVAKFFDPDSGAAITMRDVLACPKELAREILMRALASLDEGEGAETRDTLDRIAIELGGAFKTMMADLEDDGVVNQYDRHATNLARIAALATRGHMTAVKRAGGSQT